MLPIHFLLTLTMRQGRRPAGPAGGIKAAVLGSGRAGLAIIATFVLESDGSLAVIGPGF